MKDRPATLKDFHLTFDIFSPTWRGGGADIIERPGDAVSGAIFYINESQLKKLDIYEGYPCFYNRRKVNVVSQHEDLEAVTYFVVEKNKFVKPSQEYLNVIKLGLLEHGYVEKEVSSYLGKALVPASGES